MKVLLSGASGFVGSALAQRLASAGHEVLAISRAPSAEVHWDTPSLERGLARCDALVHLAGENLFAKRWSERQKAELRRSRIESTQRLAQLAAARGLKVFVQASAIGYYGASERRGVAESEPAGRDFLAQLCADWEAAAAPAESAGVRTCRVRIGVVLGPGGGALQTMLPPFRLGLGAPLGSGRQWVSWVHRADLCALFQFLLEREDARGAFNATAPEPVTMRELAQTLGRVLHRPVIAPRVPAFALRLALGEVADVLLTGQHVLPVRAQAAGFRFEFPRLEPALAQILERGAA